MITKLKEYLKREKAAALIMSEENISYFTAFHSSNGYLVVTGEKAVFLTDSRYLEAAQNKITSCDEILNIKKMSDELVAVISSLGVKKLMLESERITVARYNQLKKLFSDIELVADSGLDSEIDTIRAIKTSLIYFILLLSTPHRPYNRYTLQFLRVKSHSLSVHLYHRMNTPDILL